MTMDNNDYEKMEHGCMQGELNNANLRVFNQHFDGQANTTPNRTMIAAMAMQGILASPSIMAATTVSVQTEAVKQGIALQTKEISEITINAMAQMAVQCTDALLTELNKEKP